MRAATTYILGSNILAQALVIGSTPLLTRIYTKADFGWFGVGTVAAIVLATLLSLRLEHSIHIDKSRAAHVYSGSLFIIGFSVTILLLPLAFFVPISLVANAQVNTWFILLFAIGHAALASGTLMLNAQLRFKAIACVNLVVPLIFVLGAVSLPTFFKTANSLLAWQAIAFFTGAVLTVILNFSIIEKFNLTSARQLLIKERKSVGFLTPSSLMSIITLNLPVLVITTLFSEAAAGLVVVAQRVARAPITVIGNGLNEVLRSTIPGRETIKSTFTRVFLICSLMSAAMIAATLLIPEAFYLWLLGDSWTGLRVILFATVFGAVFQLIGTSVMSLLSSFNKAKEFQINALLLLVGIAAAAIAWLLPISEITYLWMHVLFSAVIFVYCFMIAKSIAYAELASLNNRQSGNEQS